MKEDHSNKESKVEVAKRASRSLRGTIAETLASEATHFAEDDKQLLKFHGTYQQDDRDVRRERRGQGLEKAYMFMVRLAIPAGVLTADQYLALDALIDKCGSSSLRITTRQGFQLHGVLKENLKAAIAGINHTLLTTLSACGDVERNVMACPAPLVDDAHLALRRAAREIAQELRPATGAYHEIWLDGEKAITTQPEEPFYGDRYLPRKFKTALALDGDNCVDVYSHDVGLIALVDHETITGFNLLVGGGMGTTHAKADTFARLAEPLGFVETDHAVEAVRTVAGIFRDHGNRADRRHARLKYLVAEWGMERFGEEFRKRIGFPLEQWRAIGPPEFHDHLGRHPQVGGTWFYGVYVENGRIIDTPERRTRTALRKIVATHRPGIILTGQQNLLLTGLEETAIAAIEQTLEDHGVPRIAGLSAVRRYAMACPALPTCGLALAESERLMPSIVDRFEKELASLGLGDAPITLRMTGCPNGCARPYTADIAFVGRRPDIYHVYVGGGLQGDRIVDLYAADVPVAQLTTTLHPLLAAFARERRPGQSLSDYYQEKLGRGVARQLITGREEPSEALIQLEPPG